MMDFINNPLFKEYVNKGKQGIEHTHRSKFIENRKNKCTFSIDFDKASTELKLIPKNKRWDYFIETSKYPNKYLAVEVHAYNERELREKKEGTCKIINQYCPGATHNIKSWHVIVKGEIRNDMMARFKADTKIQIHRILDFSKI